MAESEEELESLEEGERGGWKSWLEIQHYKNLNHSIQSHHFIANRREKWKQWQALFSWAPKSPWKVTDCSHKIKRCLLLGRKAVTNLDSRLKRRDIALLTKACIVKAMIFPVVMYICESWTIKKAECQKNWCFQIVVLEKTFESPLDWKEIKPVNPKENKPWIFIGRTDV